MQITIITSSAFVLIVAVILAFFSVTTVQATKMLNLAASSTVSNNTLLSLKSNVNDAIDALKIGNMTGALKALQNANNTLYSPHR